MKISEKNILVTEEEIILRVHIYKSLYLIYLKLVIYN